MNKMLDFFTTHKGSINRHSIFGIITFIIAFVYLFFPGNRPDSTIFGIIFGGSLTMLGLSVVEDGKPGA